MKNAEKYPSIYSVDNKPKMNQEIEAYYMWTNKFEKGIYVGEVRGSSEAMITRDGEEGVIIVNFSNIKPI